MLKKCFSVVVPVHNCQATLQRALDSIKQQSYRPIELILVDDGSTDNSLQLARDWAQSSGDELFSVKVLSKENGGACSARNMGILEVSGDYIQFFDSDDILDPQRFHAVAAEFEKGADFVQTGFSGFIDTPESIVEVRKGKIHSPLVYQALEGKAWANTLRCSMKKSLLDLVGPWKEEMPCFQDRYFMERAIMFADKPVVIEAILASADRSQAGVSSAHQTEAGRRWRIYCERQLIELARNKLDIPGEVWSIYKSRMYGLAFRSKASRWHDLGSESFSLAESIDAKVDKKGRLRRLAYKSGTIGSMLYLTLGKIKESLQTKKRITTGGH